jgi:hypothetical protein
VLHLLQIIHLPWVVGSVRGDGRVGRGSTQIAVDAGAKCFSLTPSRRVDVAQRAKGADFDAAQAVRGGVKHQGSQCGKHMA